MVFWEWERIMPRLEAKGEPEWVKQRIRSLLTSSGLQVFDEASRSIRFRKVRLTPSGNFPLSVYGSGEMRFEPSKKGSTIMSYTLNVSPVTVFSFAVTGLSILIFAVFVDYFLLTSLSRTNDVIIDVSVVSIVSSIVILVLIISYLRTRNRGERFLRAFLA